MVMMKVMRIMKVMMIVVMMMVNYPQRRIIV